MKNTTYKKLNYIKLTLFVFLFFVSFQSKAQFSYSQSQPEVGLRTASSSTCDGEMQAVIKDDFGSGVSDRGPRPTDFTTSYNFSSSGGIGPNGFGVMKNASQGNSAWSSGGDHTTGKNGNGYMLVFDANTTVGSVFYEKTYSGLCAGSQCTFSIFAANLVPTTYPPGSIKPKVKIDLINPLSQTVIQSFTSNELELSQQTQLLWNELSLSFTIPAGLQAITLRVSNAQANTSTNGNDVAFDDVSFSICVPPLTISTGSSKICTGDSVKLSAVNSSSTATSYSYQWQQASGTNWTDIVGETSLNYQTPSLTQTTKYRIRYAQAGVDISNNNNLLCSGSKEFVVDVTPKPPTITTTETINWNENYIWPANGLSYNSSQSGLTIVKDNCTANQVLNLTVNPKVEGVNICKGGSGNLAATNSTQSVTQFSGYWNAVTDPVALYLVALAPTACAFSTFGKGIYTKTTFSVSQSGIYELKMANPQYLQGIAYIYTGDFTPGSCSGGGIYIVGDVNNDGPGTNPRLTTHLNAGVIYTLVSSAYTRDFRVLDFSEEYIWTITTPPGGQFLLNTLNYWYTAATGGNPIGWGNSFNPVGVTGSGLPDTNTAGTKTYYVSAGTASSLRTPVTFTILEDATVGTASLSPTVCINTQLNDITHTTVGATGIDITATGLPAGITANWTNNTITIKGTPTVSGVFNYSIPLIGGCGNNNAKGTIKVMAKPLVDDITASAALCVGDVLTLTAPTVNDNGSIITDQGWYLDGTAFISGTIITYANNNQKLTYNVTNSCGTTVSNKVIITVNPTATVDAVTPQTVCNGAATTAIDFTNAVAGTTYAWTNDNASIGLPASGTGTIAAFTANNTTTAPVTATIKVTPTANGCQGTASSFTITVNPTATVDAVTPQTVCNGAATTAIDFTNAVAGTTYAWTNDNASIGLPASGTGNIAAFTANNTTTAPVTATIKVTPTANGCQGTPINFNIIVNPTATVDTVAPQTLCNGESTTAIDFANAVAGTTYTWTNNTPAIGLQASGTGNIAAFTATNTTTAPVTATITVTPTANGCTGTAQTFTITVISKIIPALIEDSLLPEICAGDKNGAFSIEVSGGKAPFSYSLDKKTGTFLQGTFEQKVFDFENLSAGKHIFYINNALGCSAQLEIIIPAGIVINPVAEINYSCVNNTAENSVVINIDSSIKNRADVDYSLDGGSYQPENIFKNISPGTHTITARHTNGCEKTTLPFIIDDVQPLILILADGELNEIIATATGGKGNYQYTFEGESGSSYNKLIIYKSGIYTVMVTDSNGCTATATKHFDYVDVCISNYFTPNGDGVNDTWGPECTVNYKHLTYSIFDRYGRTIGTYKLGQKWDGKYNGAELTSGDYWYVLKLNDPKDNREFVGHFTLYR